MNDKILSKALGQNSHFFGNFFSSVDNTVIYAELPNLNQPVKPIKDVLNIRGPVNYIQGV